jgi:hypothetical protein
MAIKRYFASKDNTITNAYEFNLKTRATGSNMGQADILETFSIYAQVSSSSGYSSELARSLLQFSTTDISTDRTAGTIPASGSITWYLKMYNARHGLTLPKNYTLQIKGISGSWEEGHGLDMDNYTDLVHDNPGSNWIFANNDSATATATLVLQGGANLAAMDAQTFTLTNTAGTSQTFTFDFDGTSLVNGAIGFSGDSNTTNAIDSIKTAINNVTALGITAGTATAAGDSDSQMTLPLTQSAAGRAGNRAIDVSGVTHLTSTPFSSGDGEWVNEGGDYYSSPYFTQSFDVGSEDLKVDVTDLVEHWLASTKPNHGFAVMFSSSLESESRSYYTKKFFGRGTEFFFKRPTLEARWDSSRHDDRGNFYYSSSLAPAEDNMNTIFLYNYVRGKLRNIPGLVGNGLYVSIFSGSAKNTDPYGAALQLAIDASSVTTTGGNTIITASYVSTGIYKASFALTAPNPPPTTLYDVWFSGSEGATFAASTQYHTASISPSSLTASSDNPTYTYVSKITNLRPLYRKTETARFRLFVREKEWSPTIYTKASTAVEGATITSGSYRLYRIIDELSVVPHGTGSTLHTLMSYDNSGNYFDLDMNMLEADYAYVIELSYYNDAVGSWVKQPEKFKFRVE